MFNVVLTPSEIIDNIKRSGLIDIEFADSTQVIGVKKRVPLNFAAYGVARHSQRAYTTYPMSCRVQIDMKDNRYRVTLSEFIFYPTRDVGSGVAMSGVAVSSKTNANYTQGLNVYYNYKRAKFFDDFADRDAPVFNDIFMSIFDMSKRLDKPEDEW